MSAAISVVIPAYNAEGTLARALDSVLAQTLPPAEIVVVDDGSTDATAAVARTYGERGVNLLVLKKRGGAAGARNAGIEAARCPWVAFLDADDEWLPSKLEDQSRYVEIDPKVGLVYCASCEISAQGGPLGDTFGGREPDCGAFPWKALLVCNFVATPTVVASRSLLLHLGGFDTSLVVGEDQDMWIRLALNSHLAYVPKCLVRVHLRSNSLSAWRLADQYSYVLPMIERHLKALGSRLTPAEKRKILAGRLRGIGINACANEDVLRGMRLILRSAILGYRPLQGFLLFLRISIAAVVKRCLRSRLLQRMVE